MSSSVVKQDKTASYAVKEGGPIVVGLGWVLAIGGAWLAANLICGWGKVKSISVGWTNVTIVCK